MKLSYPKAEPKMYLVTEHVGQISLIRGVSSNLTKLMVNPA